MNYFITKQRVIPAAIGIAIFASIAYFIMTRDTLAFDTVICDYIYSLRNDTLTVVLTVITYLGNWQVATLFCSIFLFIPRFRSSFGVPLTSSALLAVSTYKVLKTAFHRQRPNISLHLINQGGYSFPSGHSFSILVIYGMLIFLCRRYIKDKRIANLVTVLLSCLIFLIGFSRIYLGVHYPTDVLGGWSLGISFLMVFISAVLFFQREKSK